MTHIFDFKKNYLLVFLGIVALSFSLFSSVRADTYSKPTVTTGSATSITSTTATLNATVNNSGDSSAYIVIFYKKSSDSSWTTALNKYVSNSGDQDFSVIINNLSTGTKYYYVAGAKNSAGTKYGSVKSFTTSLSNNSSSSHRSSSSSAKTYTLTVKISGAGKVMSISNDSSTKEEINCKKNTDGKIDKESVCKVKFAKGEQVELQNSTPSTQYEFAIWGGNCRSSEKNDSCVIKMSSNKTVSATFDKKTEGNFTVSVRKTGAGNGTVKSYDIKGRYDGKINCGNNCSGKYETICANDRTGAEHCGYIILKASSSKGSKFSGWENCSPSSSNDSKNDCYVYLSNEDRTIYAKFEGSGQPIESGNYTLKVKVDGNGVVKDTSQKYTYINCGNNCDVSYNKSNKKITLEAIPTTGYKFSKWSGDCKSTNKKCEVKMNASHSVTATFVSKTPSSSSSSKSSSSTASSPTVTTGSANDITTNHATLTGTIYPNGQSRSYFFYYIKSGDSVWSKTTQLSASGSNSVAVAVGISNLSPGSTYYYALHVYDNQNSKWITGGTKSFTTAQPSSSSSSSNSSATTASTYKLKVNISGRGRLQDNYTKFDCGSNMSCQANYSKGQIVRVKTEDMDGSGNSFNTKVKSWSGAGCSGTGSSCDITMDSDKEVTVTFESK